MPLTPACCQLYVSPSDLWLQIREENGEQILSLMKDLMQLANDSQSTENHNYRIGERVLAKCDYNLWFRAQLLSQQSDQWTVRLVDFGWPTTVKTNRLLSMPKKLDGVSDFAVRCRLDGVSEPASGWTGEQKRQLERQIADSKTDLLLMVDFKWGCETEVEGPVPVELFVKDQSVNKEFARVTGTRTPVWETSRSFESPVTPPRQDTEPQSANPHQPITGRVSHVMDSGLVFVQSDLKRLRGLQDQLEFLQITDNLERFSPTHLPNKDEIFAIFRPDQRHFRGRLLQNKGGRAHVLIVDFGFELIVNWEDCARIPKRIRYEPQCQAFELHGAENFAALDDSLERHWQFVLSTNTTVPVVVNRLFDQQPKEVPTAVIKVKDSEQNFVEFLLQQGGSEESLDSFRRDANFNWDVDNIVSAVCVSVDDSGDVFFREAGDSNIQALQAIFDNVIEVENLARPAELRVGLPVIVSENNQFRRATIESFNAESGQCELQLVDIGRQIQASTASLYTAPTEVMKIPVSSVRCKLQNDSAPGVGDLCTLMIKGRDNDRHIVQILRYEPR